MIASGLIAPDTPPIVSELPVELGDRVFECAYRREPEGEDTLSPRASGS